MAVGIYEGVSGVARKVKSGFMGVSNVARKIKNGYVGVSGVARKFWSGGEHIIYDYGTNPYNLHVWSVAASTSAISLKSDHISYVKYTYDTYEYKHISKFVWSDQTFSLSSLDDYSEVVMVVNTYGVTAKAMSLGIAFGKSGSINYIHSTATFRSTDTTVSSSIREISIAISDSEKATYKEIYEDNGPLYVSITNIAHKREGEDYDEVTTATVDIYGIYLR